jgi:uncharacterized protein YciI
MKRITSRSINSRLFTWGMIISLAFLFSACASKNKGLSHAEAQRAFDPELARELGADDYGMKKYVMAFLKAGPNPSPDAETRQKLQRAHLDNIGRLAEEGKLVLAGPFLDDGELRGIYLFNVETLEEAEELTKTDPAIKAGSLMMELHPWYGSAALIRVVDWHAKIAKIDI